MGGGYEPGGDHGDIAGRDSAHRYHPGLAGDDGGIERLWFRSIHKNQIRALPLSLAACKGEGKKCHANPASGA
jgi:hypothetical protein